MEKIGYQVGECVLGALLVAATERGVCAILMGDDGAGLARDLQRRFPQAERVAGDLAPGHFDKVAAFIAWPRSPLDLPLDPRGSEQQTRVWQALRGIPPGSVETYADVGGPIGVTAKEVGEACAANAIAVAIPCHRVVRSDGTLAGYRWGAKRKLALLKLEGARLGPTPDLFDSAVH
jgi:AraC family transcriptional regulator, regulatory protein of adaptative response / methylated-DNA-[protein]-cysteine methyltransferase